MPNKTIYVSQDDVSVYDEAKQKAGNNLSSVISGALREYVGRQDSKEKGFNEVSVTLGSPGYEHEKRFMGRRLLSTFDGFTNASRGVVVSKNGYKGYSIYETRKGQYAVVTCSLPDPFVTHTGTSSQLHQAIAMDDDPAVGNKAVEMLLGYTDGNFSDFASDYTLEICPKLSDVGKVVPKTVYKELQDRLEQIKNPVEYLDI